MAQQMQGDLRLWLQSDRPGQRFNCGYKMEFLIKLVRLAGFIKSDKTLKTTIDLVGRSLRFGDKWLAEDVCVPSASTLHRHRFTLDCGLALMMRRFFDNAAASTKARHEDRCHPGDKAAHIDVLNGMHETASKTCTTLCSRIRHIYQRPQSFSIHSCRLLAYATKPWCVSLRKIMPEFSILMAMLLLALSEMVVCTRVL